MVEFALLYWMLFSHLCFIIINIIVIINNNS